MSIDNNGERLGVGIELPTLSPNELEGLYREGWDRVGVVAAVLDSSFNILLLEHKKSEKTDDGMLGALGETALIFPEEVGWRIENPVTTLLRGIEEEAGVRLTSESLRVAETSNCFTLGWPVGVKSLHESAFAICPLVIVDDAVKDELLSGPPTEEISSKYFVPFEEAELLPDAAFRPGMREWLTEAGKLIQKARLEPQVGIKPPEEVRMVGTDAILRNVFDLPRE